MGCSLGSWDLNRQGVQGARGWRREGSSRVPPLVMFLGTTCGVTHPLRMGVR